MKKLLILLALSFGFVSCINDDKEGELEKYNLEKIGRINHDYDVSKTIIQDHSYIIVESYYGIGITHDPECELCKIENL